MTFEIALTGINAASTQLEVISSNIANNATTGFKRARADFADVYSTTALGIANGATGSGVRVASITQEFSQGEANFTDNNMDLSITGEGFFRLDEEGTVSYSRAGAFGLDNEGFIVNSSGMNLTGYIPDANGVMTSTLENLRIDRSDLEPRQTSEMNLGLNLDTKADALAAFDVSDSSTYNFSTSTTIYNSQGSPHEATIFFHKDNPNEWTAFTFVEGVEVSAAGGDKLVFDTEGSISTINGTPGSSVTTTAFTPTLGVNPQTITLNLDDVKQFDNSFAVHQIHQDGYSTGRLQDIQISDNGIIYGRYSNRESNALGQIVLSDFANAQGLASIGDSNWSETFSSGVSITGEPGSASLGSIQSGTLEQSNVDITQELVAMIGAQRSFQANAQVISTADKVTQTIINIR